MKMVSQPPTANAGQWLRKRRGVLARQSHLAQAARKLLRRLRRETSSQPTRLSSMENDPFDALRRMRSSEQRRRTAMLGSPLSLRLQATSSWKETSSCQWRAFSMVQWARTVSSWTSDMGYQASAKERASEVVRGVANRVDRRNLTTIAVERICGDNLPRERDQAENLESGVQFATLIAGQAGKRQAQSQRLGRDNHPGVRALTLISSAAQRLAIDGDHIAVPEQCRDLHLHTPEGPVEHLRVDHAQNCREGIVRGDRMPELQEVTKNAFLCAAEGGPFGGGGRATHHRNEREDEKFVPSCRALSARGSAMSSKAARQMFMMGTGFERWLPHPEPIPPPAARGSVQGLNAN